MGNVTHLYFTNSWYRYASLQASRLDKTNCYVCTLMPTSYFHPRLKLRLLSFQATICVGEKCAPDNWGYSKPFYYTDDTRVQDLCNNTHPLAELKNMPHPCCHLMTVDSIFPICFASNGTMKLGSLRKKQ